MDTVYFRMEYNSLLMQLHFIFIVAMHKSFQTKLDETAPKKGIYDHNVQKQRSIRIKKVFLTCYILLPYN